MWKWLRLMLTAAVLVPGFALHGAFSAHGGGASVWLGMAVGCLGILLMHHTVGGKWGMMIRRMCEAGARTLPYMIILLIPVLLNLPTLYPWARPEAAHDSNLVAKSAYLNVPGVLAEWIILANQQRRVDPALDAAELDLAVHAVLVNVLDQACGNR